LGCEMLRIQHFLYNRPLEGDNVVSLTRQDNLFSLFLVLISVRSFTSKVIVRLKVLGKLNKSNDLIGIPTRDLTACSKVAQASKRQSITAWYCKKLMAAVCLEETHAATGLRRF
jgi:hypothetical protein